MRVNSIRRFFTIVGAESYNTRLRATAVQSAKSILDFPDVELASLIRTKSWKADSYDQRALKRAGSDIRVLFASGCITCWARSCLIGLLT